MRWIWHSNNKDKGDASFSSNQTLHKTSSFVGKGQLKYVCIYLCLCKPKRWCASRLWKAWHFKMNQQHPSPEVQRHIGHAYSRNKRTHAPYRILLKAGSWYKHRGIPWMKLSRPELIPDTPNALRFQTASLCPDHFMIDNIHGSNVWQPLLNGDSITIVTHRWWI